MKLFQVDIDENGDEVKYTEVSWLDLVAKEAARLRQVNSPTSLQEFRSPNSRRLKVFCLGRKSVFIIKGRIRIRSSIFYKKCLVSDPDSKDKNAVFCKNYVQFL